jgi:hypothetical protein
LTLKSTVIDGDCAGFTITSFGYNIESPGDTCGLDQVTDQPATTPGELNLGPLQGNGGPTMTHALRVLPTLSVAIGWIPEADCVDAQGQPLRIDQRGVTRPQGPACDVGSFESEDAALCEGVCDDGNPCTQDVCDPATGTCDYPPAEDGTECTGGICLAGVCEPLCVANVCECSERGIRAAIQLGGNDPYTFDCDGPTPVGTKAEIEINNDVILDGEGNLIVDGNAMHRVFSVATGVTAELRDVTVTRGAAQDYGGGGGILNGGALTLTKCTVSENSAWYFAGGILNDGVLTLTNSAVSGNSAGEEGGGIYNDGVLTLTDSTVSNNFAAGYYGGGIANYGELTLTNSTVSRNEAGSDGGGIENGGELTLTNSTVSDNSAAYLGGGIDNWEGVLTLANSTVSGNSASYAGGGILNSFGSATVTNSTVSGNLADEGGGIANDGTLMLSNSTLSNNSASYAGGGISNYGAVSLINTLVDGDCAADFGGITSNGYNIESAGDTCGFDQEGDQASVSANDLNLGPLADNGGPTLTHKPGDGGFGDGSAAIDQIPEANCGVATDQRGQPRPVGPESECDVGSVEVQSGGMGGAGGAG